MNKAEQAGREIRSVDTLAAMSSPLHRLQPLAKLLVTLGYIFTVVSFGKYELSGMAVMLIFPALGYSVSEISILTCFRKMRIALPLVCAVGLFNPFFDREILLTIGNINVSGGVVSMLTLMLKGVLCIMASFLLAATTPIEKICGAMRQLKVPKMFVSLLLLTYRYVAVLLEEAQAMTQSYHLRAPGQKGIAFKAWGSFLGQLLLRSHDRAEILFDSMLLRGYTGDFPIRRDDGPVVASVAYALITLTAIVLCRVLNIAELIGGLIHIRG